MAAEIACVEGHSALRGCAPACWDDELREAARREDLMLDPG